MVVNRLAGMAPLSLDGALLYGELRDILAWWPDAVTSPAIIRSAL